MIEEASLAAVTGAPIATTGQELVFLNELHARVDLRRTPDDVDAAWYLDTGASNHMTGDEAAFAELDKSIRGSVRFGDGSLVLIQGRGTILFATAGEEHRALTNVYWIPRLNIMRLRLANPVCLAVHSGEEAWRWHARFGHQHFDGLERLARQNMVRGLPLIHHTEQVCDACLVDKQRRASFPQQANYHATEPLELVHGDLCGPISPPTPGDKRYFLLLVDDHSRFMWLYLLRSKDEAAEAIKRFQAHAERETGRKLRTFRSDRGGEFNSGEFSAYLADLGVQRHLTAVG